MFVVLVMIWATMRLLTGETDEPQLPVLGRCVLSAATLFVSLALYFAVYRLVLKMTGIAPETGYNGMTGVGNYEGYNIFELAKGTYAYPFEYLIWAKGHSRKLTLLMQGIVLLYGAAATGYVLWKKRIHLLKAVCALGILLLLPAGMNCMYLISKGLVHDLMVYAFCFADVYAVAISEYAWSLSPQTDVSNVRKVKRAALCTLPLALSLLLFDKTIYANHLYLRKNLEYDATQSVMTRVADRLEQLDGYQIGQTPVKFVGLLGRSLLAAERSAFDQTTKLAGAFGVYALTFEDTYWTFWSYLYDVMGYPIAQFEGELSPAQQLAAENMPRFPEKGSVQMVDGVAIVKLSD